MSDTGLIRGRRGENIRVEEYPPGFMENLNERINGLPEPEEGWMDRAAEWVFNNLADGTGLKGIFLIVGVGIVSVVVAQVARIL